MLNANETKVREERSSTKQPMSDADVQALLKAVDSVVIAKGRGTLAKPSAETALADLKGPTGNYRAPLVRKGKTLLVGFNDEALKRLL